MSKLDEFLKENEKEFELVSNFIERYLNELNDASLFLQFAIDKGVGFRNADKEFKVEAFLFCESMSVITKKIANIIQEDLSK